MKSKIQKVDDQALWIALTNGQQEALAELWKRYYLRLHLYAQHMLHDYHYAEDAAQEVFKKLWEKRDTLKPTDNVEAYLYVMVINACIDAFRKGKMQLVEYREADQLPVQAVVYDPLTSREAVQLITEAINSLPPAQRQVFEERLRELRYSEIAQHAGKSTNTIRNQLAIARETLRKKLFFLR